MQPSLLLAHVPCQLGYTAYLDQNETEVFTHTVQWLFPHGQWSIRHDKSPVSMGHTTPIQHHATWIVWHSSHPWGMYHMTFPGLWISHGAWVVQLSWPMGHGWYDMSAHEPWIVWHPAGLWILHGWRVVRHHLRLWILHEWWVVQHSPGYEFSMGDGLYDNSSPMGHGLYGLTTVTCRRIPWFLIISILW